MIWTLAIPPVPLGSSPHSPCTLACPTVNSAVPGPPFVPPGGEAPEDDWYGGHGFARSTIAGFRLTGTRRGYGTIGPVSCRFGSETLTVRRTSEGTAMVGSGARAVDARFAPAVGVPSHLPSAPART